MVGRNNKTNKRTSRSSSRASSRYSDRSLSPALSDRSDSSAGSQPVRDCSSRKRIPYDAADGHTMLEYKPHAVGKVAVPFNIPDLVLMAGFDSHSQIMQKPSAATVSGGVYTGTGLGEEHLRVQDLDYYEHMITRLTREVKNLKAKGVPRSSESSSGVRKKDKVRSKDENKREGKAGSSKAKGTSPLSRRDGITEEKERKEKEKFLKVKKSDVEGKHDIPGEPIPDEEASDDERVLGSSKGKGKGSSKEKEKDVEDDEDNLPVTQ